METKEQVQQSRPRPPPAQSMDIFEMQTQKKSNPQSAPFDPFSMDSAPKQSPNMFQNNPSPPVQNQDPFDFTNPPAQKQPQSIPKAQPDDLDIFFGTPSNQPMMNQPVTNNKPPQNPNRPPNNGNINKNDVSGFSVYNQLNTSNMKDMSAMGINNFLDINQQTDNGNEQQKPKFDLRDEPSGTIFDNGSNNNAVKR
jgi:hypothetical protein